MNADIYGYDFDTRSWCTNPEYKEILKLDQMLTEANIPHTLKCLMDGWQVCYPTERQTEECIMDAIEHRGSYGHECDELEIMGLLTPEEEVYDSVLGHLTAEDVFERIRKHYNGEWNDYIKKLSEETTSEASAQESPSDHIITPEEAVNTIRDICDRYDDNKEVAHIEMDGLMCDILRQFGYGEMVDIFDNADKWYA